jgi:hypothetical protein
LILSSISFLLPSNIGLILTINSDVVK